MISGLLLAAGMIVLGVAWLSPVAELVRTSFAAHMIVHVAVVAVAAPLIGIGLAAQLNERSRLVLALLAPVPASVLEFIAIWSWHVPALHTLARSNTPAFVAEQASFLLVGLMLWTSVFRKSAGIRAGGIVALLLTSMHMILLGTLLTLAPRSLYSHAHAGTGDTLLDEQQLGGILMLAGGALPYLAGGLYLTWRLLETPTATMRSDSA